MLNQLPIISTVRPPRGIVVINGAALKWISFRIDTTTYYRADTFEIEFPLSEQPAGFDFNYFSSTPAILAEIYAGFPPDSTNFRKEELDNLIVGQVDDVSVDPVKGIISLTGRDLTAKFIDNKTYEKFNNMTASQIAILLAKRRGLTPIVTPTKTIVGQYYEIDQARVNSLQSEWDLLTFLAQEENFAVFVKGMELRFQPLPKETDEPYVLQWNKKSVENNSPTFNGISLKCARSMTIARDVIVKVRSWNALQKRAFTVTAKATPNKKTALANAAQPIGDAQTYTYIFPGLTKEQAQQKAQALLNQITQHERRIEVELPGDNRLNKQNVIQLKGTETDFDQVYFPDSIVRNMGIDEAYKMTITAKNHSPNTEVLI